MTTFPTKLGFMGRTGTGSMTGPHARPCSRSLTLCRFSRHSAGLKPLTPSRGIVARGPSGPGRISQGTFRCTACVVSDASILRAIARLRILCQELRLASDAATLELHARAIGLSRLDVRRGKRYVGWPDLQRLRADEVRARRDGKGDRLAASANPSPRHQPPCDATSEGEANMAGLKKIVGVTLAVVLVTALVVYVLRPSATPTTTSTAEPGTPTVQPPPTDQGTCRDQGHGHHDSECDNATGSGHDSDRDNDTDDHDGASGHSDDNETNDHEGHDGESDQNAAGHNGDGHDSDQNLGDDNS